MNTSRLTIINNPICHQIKEHLFRRTGLCFFFQKKYLNFNWILHHFILILAMESAILRYQIIFEENSPLKGNFFDLVLH